MNRANRGSLCRSLSPASRGSESIQRWSKLDPPTPISSLTPTSSLFRHLFTNHLYSSNYLPRILSMPPTSLATRLLLRPRFPPALPVLTYHPLTARSTPTPATAPPPRSTTLPISAPLAALPPVFLFLLPFQITSSLLHSKFQTTSQTPLITDFQTKSPSTKTIPTTPS